MPNKEYAVTLPSGMQTTLLLSDEEAERHGLKGSPESKSAKPANKQATPANKSAAADKKADDA